MRKMLLATAFFVVALFGFSTAASASIISPASGPITANGDVTLRGSFVNTTCGVSISGTIVSGGRSVTGNTGRSTGCGTGTLVFNSLGTKLMILGTPAGTGTWRLLNVDATLTASIVGACQYQGYLGGTYENGLNGIDLTILAGSSSLRLIRGGGFCIGVPVVEGLITLLGATAG